MAARSTWKGFLKISLVNIPIKVFPATESSCTISFTTSFVAGTRGFDGINIADEVGNRYIGRGELFDVTFDRRHPRDRSIVAKRRDEVL